jgi:hypothetical protein
MICRANKKNETDHANNRFTVMRMAPTSGLALHQRLLAAVTAAPLAYFSTTETGSILNR